MRSVVASVLMLAWATLLVVVLVIGLGVALRAMTRHCRAHSPSGGHRASGKWQATRWPSPRARRGGSLAGAVDPPGRPAACETRQEGAETHACPGGSEHE